ncbi:MAG: GLPGLI family protein [Flavobacteriaceae bacterium]
MIKSKHIFHLILFYNTISYGQTAFVTYKLQSTNPSESERVLKVKKEVELMEFTLSYNQNSSFFHKEKNVPVDRYIANIASILSGAGNDFYQYSKNKTVLQNQQITGKMYQVDYSRKFNGWQLTNETKQINQYTCYKAILPEFNEHTQSTTETIAWFTLEIPAPYGPIGYGGLPGLILELTYKYAVYSVKSITLNPKKGVDFPKIKEGKVITENEWVVLMRKARKVTDD